jgi:hypothetical protein
VQSVLIITKVVSSNPSHGEVFSIQHVVIKFAIDLQATGRWFPPGSTVSSINKALCHNIAEILLKVALSTIALAVQQINTC